MKQQNENEEKSVLYGRNAVFSALRNKKRKIIKVLIAPENEAEFKKQFPNIAYQIVLKKEFEKIFSPNAVHQGYALYTKPLPKVYLEDIIAQTNEQKKCHVLILDHLTDPQNIGAIIRSAAAFESAAVILQDKNAPHESAAMAKAAAGTMEFVPLVYVTNIARAIETLKKAGFWVVGMDGYAKHKIDEIDKDAKLAVVMGSEGSGMRRLIEESCDITVRLDINAQVESLNVSTAAAIVLYELHKK